jgi:Asp-tRNA(Asn)/Glu-tRNA(Gln) amidotransferase B subunit
MANKNIYEVFNEFKTATTKKDRIEVLKKNDNWALRNVLQGALDKRVQFAITKIPDYHIEEVPPGMSYNHISYALNKVYLFMKNNSRTPDGLTEQRKEQLLIQILESMEVSEAEVYVNMIKKDLKIPYLTEALVNEAFPGLLPKS